MNKFRVKVHSGKEPHFKATLFAFDKDSRVVTATDHFIVDTKLDESELLSLTTVKFVVALTPPPPPTMFLTVERMILDVFSIPKDSKIVKLKDLDTDIQDDLLYSFNFQSGEQYCILDRSRMNRTPLDSFFSDCSGKVANSSQKEIKMVLMDSQTGDNFPILSTKIDYDYVYLEYRKSITHKF